MTDYTAVLWGTRSISYQRLEGYISSAMKLLKGRGVGPQDRLVLIGPNSVEYVIVLLALWRMGVVACPLNPHWPLKLILQSCHALAPKAILVSSTIGVENLNIPIIHFSELISFDARQPSDEEARHTIPLQQEATIIWTSGSSYPKAAVHTWGNHVYSAKGSQEVIPLKPGDRWVLSLPLYHVSGISIVVRCILAGAAIVIPGDEDLAVTIQKTKATHLSMVATQLYRWLNNPVNSATTLKAILLGGSAIPVSFMERALKAGLPIYLSYGLTEMSSQVATGKVSTPLQTCMKILPYRQLKIDTGGQILVKGGTLFKGYWQHHRMSLPLDQDGWFKTGDLGQLDDNGYLTVLGRVDNMFICAGENIQPEEIEQVLLAIPGVEQAVVVPQESQEYGHQPVAFIRCRPVFDEQLLRAHCLKYLPKIKVPAKFYPWPDDLREGIKINRQNFICKLSKKVA